MFEHLPVISEGNLSVMVDKEIGYFQDLLKRCTRETKTPDEAIDCMCEELNQLNPYLVKAVRATAYAVAGELEDDVETELAWGAGIATVPGVLAVLRLIDRALEAQQLQVKLLKQEQK